MKHADENTISIMYRLGVNWHEMSMQPMPWIKYKISKTIFILEWWT